MKKILFITLICLGFNSTGQEEITNAEGSEYKFKEIVKLDATPVESQGRTGTCWSFSTLSFLESELKRRGLGDHTLAEMWIAYHVYLGKAEKFIRMHGNANFDQGGAFHDIMWAIDRYGIVPLSAYSGIDYTSDSHNHSQLAEVLQGFMNSVLKIAESVGKNGPGLYPTWKKAFRGILNAYLGYVPENSEDLTFKVDGKEYNPITYRDKLGLTSDDYISLTSFTHYPFYEKCMIAVPDNWAWGESYNLPLNELWDVAKGALKNGYTFAWGADVSENYFDFRSGLAIVPEDKSTIKVHGKNNKNFSDAGSVKEGSCFYKPTKEEEITQEKRQIAYDNKKTQDDHGMHAVGLYEDQNGAEYLWIKNSWGTKNNDCDGYFFASKAYYEYKTLNIYLHKDALPKALKKKLGVK